jgi:stage III sporulation protein AH
MPSELLLTTNGDNNDQKVNIEESDVLAALRVEEEDTRLSAIKDLKMVLTNIESTVEEKNNAYEQLKLLDVNKGQEEKLETKIKDKYKLNCFVKINNDQIRVVIASNKHDVTLANNIMRSIQEEFTTKMYISVKFQS